MYLPSMVFGGSAILHLLAGYPRLVAIFGLAAAAGMLLYAPYGPYVLPGTTQYVQTIDQRLREAGSVDASRLAAARASAQALRTSSPAKLEQIVSETLAACGGACDGLDTESVMRNATLLEEVLLVHELNRLHDQMITRALGSQP